jgi:hypothetical protein
VGLVDRDTDPARMADVAAGRAAGHAGADRAGGVGHVSEMFDENVELVFDVAI